MFHLNQTEFGAQEVSMPLIDMYALQTANYINHFLDGNWLDLFTKNKIYIKTSNTEFCFSAMVLKSSKIWPNSILH